MFNLDKQKPSLRLVHAHSNGLEGCNKEAGWRPLISMNHSWRTFYLSYSRFPLLRTVLKQRGELNETFEVRVGRQWASAHVYTSAELSSFGLFGSADLHLSSPIPAFNELNEDVKQVPRERKHYGAMALFFEACMTYT